MDKKTPDEWSALLGVTVLDPDGWRRDRRPWSEPLTRAEFQTRAFESTVRVEGDRWPFL
jgi:hypothetical protein